MKVAVVGAGAMGCRFGASLQKAGNDVTLIDVWKEHVDSINRNGLRVSGETGDEYLKVMAAIDATTVRSVDLIIIFTKTLHTKSAAQTAKSLMGPETAVLTLQNGLGKEEIIAEDIEPEHIVLGSTTYSSDLIGPGHVRYSGKGDIWIMTYTGQETKRLYEIESVFNAAGLQTTVSSDALKFIWLKAAFNSAINTLSGVTRLNCGPLGRHEETWDFYRNIVKEVVTVARAKGIDLKEKDVLYQLEKASNPTYSGAHLPSMLQDVLRKKPTEIAALSGAVIKEAAHFGIAVPFNQAIYDVMRIIENSYEDQISEL